MKLRKMEALKCQNCGASELKHIRHDGMNFLKCEYCGTEYEAQEEPEKPATLPNESVSGIKQSGEYVVYGRLTVSGMNNNVILVENAPQNATSVRDLDISGMKNEIRVKLMPGATKNVSGMKNNVR